MNILDKDFFSYPFHTSSTGRKVINFGVDMSSSTKIDNRKKSILIPGKSPTQGLKISLSAEKMYSTNFTENTKRFCLSLHYNKENSYLFVNATETHRLKVSKKPQKLKILKATFSLFTVFLFD